MPDQTNPTPLPVIDEALARRVLEVVSYGLCDGRGEPTPGHMCVEAAVCYAMGLPHSDEPPCVGLAPRAYKISLNDSWTWVNKEARAEGLKALAIAQLGSDILDQTEFSTLLVRKTIQVLIPELLKEAISKAPLETRGGLEEAEERCKKEGSVEAITAASVAAKVAHEAALVVYRAASTNYSTSAPFFRPSNAKALREAYRSAETDQFYLEAVLRSIGAAKDAALVLGRAKIGDADTPAFVLAAEDVASAARSAVVVEENREAKSPEHFLRLSANLALEVLKELNSPGCEFLYLLDQPVQPAQQ